MFLPRYLFNLAKRLELHIRNATFTPRIVRHTYGALPLAVHLEDRLACNWYDRDWPELREIKLLASGRLLPGATVFDIGAHQGVVAMMLANIVGPTGRVIAIEADKYCARVARKNLAQNKVTNVQLVNAAVAAAPGMAEFSELLHVDDGEPGLHARAIKAVTVDTLAEEFGIPDVLFIDVEGYECQVLHGAAKTLQSRPDLFIEVHVGKGLETFGGSVSEVLKLLPAGSDVYVAEPHDDHGQFVPLAASGTLMQERFFLVAKA
jgi:FkbM family methyltransferase